MGSSRRRWSFALALLLLLLLILSLVVVADLDDQRSVISSGGGQISQGSVTLKSAIGQPVVGCSSNGIKLSSGFYSGDCATGVKVFLPAITSSG